MLFFSKSVGSLILYENYTFGKGGGVLESRISSPYPGANHVAPPATKDVVFNSEVYSKQVLMISTVVTLHSKTDCTRGKAESVKQTHGSEAQRNESSSS